MYTGGSFGEKKVSDDTYIITFNGEADVSEQHVMNMLYLRCAELALASGKKNFKVLKDRNQWESSTFTHGFIPLSTEKKYQVTNMVQFLESPDPNVQNYDAYAIYHNHKKAMALVKED